MTNQPSDIARRRLLKIVSLASPLLAAGGLASCTTRAGEHGLDEPHLGESPNEAAWRELAAASFDPNAFAGGFPPTLVRMAGQELMLDGFVRRTPNLGRYLLTRRAVGCSVCNRQRLWPALDLVFADPAVQPKGEPVRIRGTVELRHEAGRLPVGLSRAYVTSA